MKFYNQLLSSTAKNYKHFIFISLFYSLWIVYKYAGAFHPELTSFPGRMIGSATLEGYDIGARVSAFYRAGLLFLLTNILVAIIAWKISPLKELLRSVELRIINYTALAGIILWFFVLYGSAMDSSLELIYCIHKIVLMCLGLKVILLKGKSELILPVSFYSLLVVIGVSFYFLGNELLLLAGFSAVVGLLASLFFTVVAGAAFTMSWMRNKSQTEFSLLLNTFAYVLVPLASIPVLSFFKTEIYLIFNKHGIFSISEPILYVLGILTVSFFITRRYFKAKNRLSLKTTDQFISKVYFPWLVIGLVTFIYYAPFMDTPSEMFESGNRFLPVMEHHQFGMIPVIEKFNSHLLSEILFGSIYTFFNGLHGREMLLYDFMDLVLWLFLLYHFVLRLSRNAYIALFIVFLFPLTEALIPGRPTVALLALFLIHKIIEERASVKNYVLLFICITFLIIWRMDIGYPALIAIVGTLLIYQLSSKKFYIDKKIFIRSVLYFGSSAFILLIAIGAWRHINVFGKMMNGLNYLASAQSYGAVTLGNLSAGVLKMQYFVFPILIILLLGILVVFFKRYTISRPQRFVHTAFVFLIIYYIVNFQRGIVAHTLASGSDHFMSSFSFLIFAAAGYLFFYNRSQASKFILFISLSVFLIMNYKLPAIVAPENIYSELASKKDPFVSIKADTIINRCTDTLGIEEKYCGEFKKFISENLTPEQTFLDFSNSPMLYYYTGKVSPSYFFQNPITSHNDFLQDELISNLKNYDCPFVVFSSCPKTYWDAVDGVPNEVRHYKIAEYIYKNYQPFVIVNGFCVWKRIYLPVKLENDPLTVYHYYHDSMHIESVINEKVNFKKGKKYFFNVSGFGYAFLSGINIHNNNVSAILNFTNFHFIDDRIIVPDSLQGEFNLTINNSKAKINQIWLQEQDYLDDGFSMMPQKCDLKLLPYIWANYDKTSRDSAIQSLTEKPVQLKRNEIEYFNFNNSFDKKEGNYVLIKVNCKDQTEHQLELVYGVAGTRFMGSFSFTVPRKEGEQTFKIRISSQYNWYDEAVNYVGIVSKDADDVTVTDVKLLKGN